MSEKKIKGWIEDIFEKHDFIDEVKLSISKIAKDLDEYIGTEHSRFVVKQVNGQLGLYIVSRYLKKDVVLLEFDMEDGFPVTINYKIYSSINQFEECYDFEDLKKILVDILRSARIRRIIRETITFCNSAAERHDNWREGVNSQIQLEK